MDADRIAAGEDSDRLSDPYVEAITDDREWLPAISEACYRFDINTEDRLVTFLANCAHESKGFGVLVESMHYSAARLLAVFPKHFTPAESVEFAYDDIRIAERVYGGRMGNGSEGTGDGYRYRGRGLAMITGAGMYRKCGRTLGIDLESFPDMLEQPTFAALSAGWFFAEEKLCNGLADAGKFESVVRLWNGGLNGLDDRLSWLDRLRAV